MTQFFKIRLIERQRKRFASQEARNEYKKHRFPEFTAGSAVDAYSYLGAHPDKKGWTFRVWAPAAKAVSLVGDFNGWNDKANTMFPLGDGIWEVHVDGLEQYDIYKYAITGSDGQVRFKGRPLRLPRRDPPRHRLQAL